MLLENAIIIQRQSTRNVLQPWRAREKEMASISIHQRRAQVQAAYVLKDSASTTTQHCDKVNAKAQHTSGSISSRRGSRRSWRSFQPPSCLSNRWSSRLKLKAFLLWHWQCQATLTAPTTTTRYTTHISLAHVAIKCDWNEVCRPLSLSCSHSASLFVPCPQSLSPFTLSGAWSCSLFRLDLDANSIITLSCSLLGPRLLVDCWLHCGAWLWFDFIPCQRVY